MRKSVKSNKTQWFFWLGISLLIVAGIFLVLIIRHLIVLSPSIGDIIILIILFVCLPSIPAIFLLKKGSNQPVKEKPLPVKTGVLSKRLFFGTTLVASILLIVLGILMPFVLKNMKPGGEASLIMVLFFFGVLCISIYIVIVFLFCLFRAWNSIQPGHPRTTPLKAIGFLFIPFYNFYWVFQSVKGFVPDYNIFITEAGIKDFHLGNRLFTSFAILFVLAFAIWLFPVPFLNAILAAIVFVILLVYTSLVIGKLCDAINIISEMRSIKISLPSESGALNELV